MTRKQAILKAIEILNSINIVDEIEENEVKEIIIKLEEIAEDLPLNRWNKKSIFDAINQWILDTGKIPSVTDLDRSQLLPSHNSIKINFNMTAQNFLDTYYRTYNKEKRNLMKREWGRVFIEEYYRIKPTTSIEFNLKRKKGIPQWETIARQLEIPTWNNLLNYYNLIPFKKEKIVKPRIKKEFKINYKIPTIETIKSLQKLKQEI